MEVLNLTAIDVNGDDKAELVGSFKISQTDKQKPPHFLFLIAELDSGIYKALRTNYQFNPEQSEYPIGREMFSDSLDIDGDGINEIMTVFTGPNYKDKKLRHMLASSFDVANVVRQTLGRIAVPAQGPFHQDYWATIRATRCAFRTKLSLVKQNTME